MPEMDTFEDNDPFPIAKKTKKKFGEGFKGMGLSHEILKGIQKRGYKVPTPIQRRTIPVALHGRDMVAMARTGSGKTACFLIPIFEKLKARVAKSGARALILLPTRELAVQTLAFIKDLGKFTDLKSCLISGGDNMDTQFEAMHGHPDIIVATPGRFVHLCVEMELKLSAVELVVFDEADRLFEMGFGEQLKDIIARLPSSRQTLLFSATLPKSLVDFTKIGLSDPLLIRLDVYSQLSDKLENNFVWCRQEEKTSVLLCLIHKIVELDTCYEKPQIVIFAATRHHVEFIHLVLQAANISSTFLFSNLDPSARKIAVGKFSNKVVQCLVVTDIAARGIDIPEVKVVINYHFPATPKLFVHRVGRCARAGKAGTAYTMTTKEDVAYMLDLHLFLGKPFDSSQLGRVPADLLEENHALILEWHKEKTDIGSMESVCHNAYGKYLRSRPGASIDSIKRSKQLGLVINHSHPVFGEVENKEEDDFLRRMKNYKPKATVFELSSFGMQEMKVKRDLHGEVIAKTRKRGQNGSDAASSKKRLKLPVDKDNYVPYLPADHHSEFGLSVKNFEHAARKVGMDVMGDEEKSIRLQDRMKRWDSKKKKMVGPKEQVKKIKTESGVWIPATYKTGKYKQWKDRSKADDQEDDEGEEAGAQQNRPFIKEWRHSGTAQGKKVKSELKRPEQIIKVREKKLKMQMKQKGKKKGGKGKGQFSSKGKGQKRH